MINIDDIRNRLENPKDEADRLAAYGELLDAIENSIVQFSEAYDLYDQWRELHTDWTAQTVSDKADNITELPLN